MYRGSDQAVSNKVVRSDKILKAEAVEDPDAVTLKKRCLLTFYLIKLLFSKNF